MKKAFFLIEFIFAIIIMGVIFAGFVPLYSQIQKHSQNLLLSQKIFELESQIYKENFQNESEITLQVQNLGEIKFIQKSNSNSVFTLKALFAGSNFDSEFKDENSF